VARLGRRLALKHLRLMNIQLFVGDIDRLAILQFLGLMVIMCSPYAAWEAASNEGSQHSRHWAHYGIDDLYRISALYLSSDITEWPGSRW
jgi:hypothetical protein